MSEPRTEAGRALLERAGSASGKWVTDVEFADAIRAIEAEAAAIDRERLALREALTIIHPLPWVVYDKGWIKNADDQWVGFTYSPAAAHLIVQIVNAIAAYEREP